MDCDKEELEATLNIAEKSADEMLEELGYEIIIKNKDIIEYEFSGIYMDNEIKFDITEKTVLREYSNGDSKEISMQELQAINLKCKELGWI